MDVKLPHLGEGADSGTVVNVFVKEGERIEKDQPVIELENEKAVAAIPSTVSGVIAKVFVKNGDKLSAGQRIISVNEGGAAAPVKAAAAREAVKTTAPTPAPVAEEAPADETAPIPNGEVAAAPSIRRMAGDFGIDLTKVRGSGRGGRIQLADVRAYIQRLIRGAEKPAAADAKPAPEKIDFAQWGEVSIKPLSSLRKVISRRMSQSWESVPRVTQFDEADVSALNDLRKKHGAAFEKQGARLTLTPFVLKALVTTLKKHPLFNSSLDETAGAIVLKQYFNLGIAVDTEAGLIVPVIRNADRKSLLELSKELEELAKKARDRKLAPEEMQGGTFTVSNQGGIGGAHFTPIVNVPEVAILGLGRAALKPAVRAGAIEARLMLPLAVSYDHRVIDGGAAARFTVDLVAALEGFKKEDAGL
jgi:pyruvate dehydrogenase E2 component (dihydrolipoamide acetyltransferase)